MNRADAAANATERQTHERAEARRKAHSDVEVAKSAVKSAEAAEAIAIAEEAQAAAEPLHNYTPYMVAAGVIIAGLFGAFLWRRA